MPEQMNIFDPVKVALEKRNLIQASAGTGKTYSLAFLTVRLLVEKGIGINQVLLVTFTKAAVAELEIRVRSFVRLGLKRARGENIGDDTLEKLIDGYVDTMGREKVEERLNRAQLLLDETSVMTIHGFCQQVLKEYAFETGQVFGSETMSPDEMNEVMRDRFYDFWRMWVTVLDPRLLERLLGITFLKKPLLTTTHLLSMVRDGIGGKIPRADQPAPPNFLEPQGQQDFMDTVERLREDKATRKARILGSLQDSGLHQRIRSDRNAKNAYDAFIDMQDWEAMFEEYSSACIKRPQTQYLRRVFGDALFQAVVDHANDDSEFRAYRRYIAWIGEAAFRQVRDALQVTLNERGLVTFDEMIRLTYQALQRPGREKLVAAMRKKYKAVFCDEYQDTDRYQHEIFKTLFYDETVLFFVGDSKQSIYAFRKADLNTFFNAEQTVDKVHQMDINHRSTEAFILAMNRFFLPQEDFPTFAFDASGPAITYTRVNSPENNKRGQMMLGTTPVIPMLISRLPNKSIIPRAVLDIILDLRQNDYRIEGRAVEFSDIGILVRTNKDGRKIKAFLSANRIPCVSIDETKIFDTPEANDVYLILLGVYEMTRGSMNRALLTSIGGCSIDYLKSANEEDILARFRAYRDVWKNEGVYVMLHKFFADHDLFGSRGTAEAGDRRLANALHLAELVHKISERKNFDMLEQIQWVKKGMDGEIREGDEFLQRLESDDQAVKIITVHKAKGLEYNIVICPYLDMMNDSSFHATGSFRDADGEYYVMDKKLMEDAQMQMYLEQSEQENRRLLYVAITRARYHCHITASMYSKRSTLRKFLDALDDVSDDVDPALIDLDHQLTMLLPPYEPPAAGDVATYETAVRFQSNLHERYWRKTSYSGLTVDHVATSLKRYEGMSNDAYDQFVFRDLRRGAQTGNLLHYIFEKIDFSDELHWSRVIGRGLKRAGASYTEALIRQLLEHVLEADLGTGFGMRAVSFSDRLSELEFDFPLQRFSPQRIRDLGTPDIPLLTGAVQDLEGMMNGKVDLVIRISGKYWIIDWKSNWLGERPEDYQGVNLAAAMADNNYHLQYHIYTLALKKFLTLNLPGFDYDRDFGGCLYLFLRGMRAGAGHGVYFHKPDPQVIGDLDQMFSGK
jgi:exodeoxyribonuclease V beta subunit